MDTPNLYSDARAYPRPNTSSPFAPSRPRTESANHPKHLSSSANNNLDGSSHTNHKLAVPMHASGKDASVHHIEDESCDESHLRPPLGWLYVCSDDNNNSRLRPEVAPTRRFSCSTERCSSLCERQSAHDGLINDGFPHVFMQMQRL
jgi:hypothetical protein